MKFNVGSIYPSREALIAERVQHNHFLSRGTQAISVSVNGKRYPERIFGMLGIAS